MKDTSSVLLSSPTPIREPAEDNSLPARTNWVRHEKSKIPKELWDKDSRVYINPAMLLLQCQLLPFLKLFPCSLAFMLLLKQVEDGFFFLMLNQLALIPEIT